LADLATALSSCITKDGQTAITANIPMAGFKLTGLGAPTTAGDALCYGSPLGPLGAATATTLVASGQITAGDGTTFHARGFGFTADFSSTNIASSSTFSVVSGGSGGVQLTSGATAWASASDESTKTGLAPIADALSKVACLRSMTGRYKADPDGTSRSFLIAQDVQAVLPEAVSLADDGTLVLRYSEVIPLLVGAIKELADHVSALEAA
jgi:hypothetical protein